MVSIPFLIAGIISTVLFCFSTWWLIHTMRNKPDFNVAENKNWFSKWLYKNQMMIAMMVTVVILICAVVFMCGAWGIIISMDQPE